MLDRYIRQIQLPEVGESGQQKLSRAKVLVIGCGGLGCPALLYLAAAGIGTLGIVDYDVIELSNLHRQILFGSDDLKKNKAISAQEKLQSQYPDIHVDAYSVPFTDRNALDLVRQYDIVVDGTDDIATRYLINDACVMLDKPMIYAALFKYEGQVSVFNYRGGATYRCLFPTPPTDEDIPDCNTTGVLGVLPGSLGVMQAGEVLKIILNLGEVLSEKVLCMNLLNNKQTIFSFRKNEKEVLAIKKRHALTPVVIQGCTFKRISLADLQHEENILWVDVREPFEHPHIQSPNVVQIPLPQLEEKITILEHQRKKVFFCQTGKRSDRAVQWAGNKNLAHCYSLKDGASALLQWLNQKA